MTYSGIIVSLFCLIISIISYLASKSVISSYTSHYVVYRTLCTSDHGQLLLNLCFSFLGLYIAFILAKHCSNCSCLVCSLVYSLLCYTCYDRKLCTSDHCQILINLCLVLTGLYIAFIFAEHSEYVPGLCALIAASLQYFFLATFMVLVAEIINMYRSLVIIVLEKRICHFKNNHIIME